MDSSARTQGAAAQCRRPTTAGTVSREAETAPLADERWRELTLQANAQHAARDYRGALRLYNAALDEAEAVFGSELRRPNSLRIIGPLLLTISDHNLAHVARVQDKAAVARQHLIVAFERLIGLGLAAELPVCIRASAARSLRPALAELLADLPGARQEARASSLVTRASAVLRSVEEAESACAH
jgi:hypothetical protein